MGFNTTLMVLNDRLDEIQQDPERFVTELVRVAAAGGETQDIMCQTRVMRPEHADVPRLYWTHGNSIIELSHYATDTERAAKSKYGREFLLSALHDAKAKIELLEIALDRWESEGVN